MNGDELRAQFRAPPPKRRGLFVRALCALGRGLLWVVEVVVMFGFVAIGGRR